MLYFLYRESHFLFSYDLGVKYALEIQVYLLLCPQTLVWSCVFVTLKLLSFCTSFSHACFSNPSFQPPKELLFIFISQNNAFVKEKNPQNNPNAQYEVCNNVTYEQFLIWVMDKGALILQKGQPCVLYDVCSCDTCVYRPTQWMRHTLLYSKWRQ